MNDLLGFAREHRALTTAYILMNLFALLVLTNTGLVRVLVSLTGFSLAYVWFLVLAVLSLMRSHEISRARRGKAWPGKPRQGQARRGEPGRGMDQ